MTLACQICPMHQGVWIIVEAKTWQRQRYMVAMLLLAQLLIWTFAVGICGKVAN